MRRLHFWIPVIAGGLACALARALPSTDETWLEVRSPHFTIDGRGTEEELRKALGDLERFRTVLDRATGLELELPRPTRLFFFTRSSEYRSYTGKIGTKPSAGYYARGHEADYIAIDGQNRQEAFAILYHEYVHSVLEATFPSVPLWLNEGLAEFYSTFRCTGNDAETGRPVEAHVRWLVNHPLLPIEKLLAVTASSEDYNEESKAGVFYAESWALVHMLLRGDRAWRDHAKEFLAIVLGGGSPESASRKAFGVGLSELDARLASYAKQSDFLYTVTTFDVLEVSEAGAARAMSRPDLLTRLGDLLYVAEQGKSPAAEAHYREALSLEPGCARATAGLAKLRAEEGKRDEARSLYDAAIAAAPADPGILFLAGFHALDALRGAEGWVTPREADAPEIVRARTLLERSFAASRENADAAALAGLTYLLAEGDAGKGIELMESASARMPRRGDVLSGLVSLYAKQGDRAMAEKTLERLIPVGSEIELAAAWETLLDLDLKESDDAVERQDYARGIELLRSVAARTTDSTLREKIRARIAMLEGIAAEKHDTERYNAILPLYKAGKWSAARKALQELLATCTTPRVCDAARKELASLPKPAGAQTSRPKK